MSDGLAARREAALRLPPLPTGRRDPLLEEESCYICGSHDGLVRVFGRLMCRDRVDCYQRCRAGQ